MSVALFNFAKDMKDVREGVLSSKEVFKPFGGIAE